MKKIYILLVTFLLLFLAGSAYSQSLHVVVLTNNIFTPNTLTITVGDTVRWINEQGFHNVGFMNLYLPLLVLILTIVLFMAVPADLVCQELLQ